MLAVAVVLVTSHVAQAQDPLNGNDPFGGTLPGESVQRADPMDSGPLGRLRKRSPGQRWEETKQTWSLPDSKRPFANSLDPSTFRESSRRPAPATTASRIPQSARPVTTPQPADRGLFAEIQSPGQRTSGAESPFGYALLQPEKQDAAQPVKPSPFSDGDGDPLHRKITEIQPFHDYIPSDIERATGVVPVELDPPSQPYQERNLTERVFTWEASNLYHMPLYFDDPTLERYGHTHHELVQPFVSTARFGVQLFGLPYSTAIDPICKKRYTLGFYRPGECVPYLYHQVPLNEDAFSTTLAFYTGMFFLFP